MCLIRPARGLEDAEGMRCVRNECRNFMTRDRAFISIPKQISWWTQLPKNIQPFVVELSSEIVGYGLIMNENSKAWLTGALTESTRGHGCGKRLFSYLISKVDKRTPWVEVLDTNVRARALYTKLGFVEHGCFVDANWPEGIVSMSLQN